MSLHVSVQVVFPSNLRAAHFALISLKRLVIRAGRFPMAILSRLILEYNLATACRHRRGVETKLALDGRLEGLR